MNRIIAFMGALTYNRAPTLPQQLRDPFLLFFSGNHFFYANHLRQISSTRERNTVFRVCAFTPFADTERPRAICLMVLFFSVY
jgi:hypothetical protein